MMQTIIKSGSFTPEEIRSCILLTKKRWGLRLPERLTLLLERSETGDLIVTYDPPIDRQVYRSTDYLVGDLSRLNKAKRSEQQEKQTHL